ncbi:MAG: hypothetical protein V3S71_08405, partial [Acidobacteriota bacterium]
MVDACDIEATWKLDPELARMVALTVNQAELEMGRPARIISGFRTDVEQIALGRAGRPAVHPSIS